MDRREFLKNGLIFIAAAAVALACHVLRAVASTDSNLNGNNPEKIFVDEANFSNAASGAIHISGG